MKKLLCSLIDPVDIYTKALAHGKKYERVAISKLEDLCSVKVLQCGLFVCAEYPMLAASPDGLISDDAVVEVKCPYTARNDLITETSVPYLTACPTGGFLLNKDHQYYYQVQGQLLCTGRQRCKFVVFTLKGLEVVDVHRDDIFINSMTTVLLEFYEQYFKPAIIKKHLYKDEHLYNFSH